MGSSQAAGFRCTEECCHLCPDACLPVQVWSLPLGMQCIQLHHGGHPVTATGRWVVPPNRLHVNVRAHLRLGTCYILVLAELQRICRMDTQGDKSLLDAWAEMRRKLSSHSA